MNNLPLNIDFQQILLHLLNVVILFAVLYFLIYKPVKKFMDKRRQEYQDMEDAANQKLQEADELKDGYEAKLQDAEDEIRVMKQDASRALDQQNTQILEQAREQADRIVQKARLQAEKEQEKILEDAEKEVSAMAKEAVSKMMFDSPSEAYDSFLNAAKGQSDGE